MFIACQAFFKVPHAEVQTHFVLLPIKVPPQPLLAPYSLPPPPPELYTKHYTVHVTSYCSYLNACFAHEGFPRAGMDRARSFA